MIQKTVQGVKRSVAASCLEAARALHRNTMSLYLYLKYKGDSRGAGAQQFYITTKCGPVPLPFGCKVIRTSSVLAALKRF